MEYLTIKHIKKVYVNKQDKGSRTLALRDINLSVEQGEYIAIMGESGSGKTTLLNIIATLIRPSGGEIFLNDKRLTNMNDAQSSAFRREHLGFVFQNFNLLDIFNAKDNILLPVVLANEKVENFEQRIMKLSKVLKVEKILDRYPYQLSGGQKQRIAIIRALIMNPDLVLADEPTGALDSSTSGKLLDVFRTINKKEQTILMVTHSAITASHANRILFIKDGKIFNQLYRGESTDDELCTRIMSAMTTTLK